MTTAPTGKPAWKDLLGPAFMSLVLIVVPEIPGLEPAVAFERLVRIPLALTLFGAIAFGHFTTDVRGRAVALTVSAALRVVFLVATGKAGTLMWAMTVAATWREARDARSGRAEAILSFAEPAVALLGFWARGGHVLVVPVTMTLVGPTMHALLSRQARRIRALEEEAHRLHIAALRTEADHQRALVLEDVNQRLGGELREIADLARREEESLQAGQPTALGALSDRIRGATFELRAAIWALDPGEESWENVEARLRRIVSDQDGISFRSEVPAGHRLTPADRVELARSVRATLGARGTSTVRIRLEGARFIVDAAGSAA